MSLIIAKPLPAAAASTTPFFRRCLQRNGPTLQLRATTSSSPDITQASPERFLPGAKLFPAIALVDGSITIDPIENIRVALSFNDLKPNGGIIDEDRMPGKPSPPAGAVFGSYLHFMILSLGSRMERTDEPRVGAAQIKSCVEFLLF